ncbi:MAG: hypothetical protein M0Z66_09905 [Thermaerobacter sp.]|nr:hypothetical protein [Thermaerobacter sp.]
MAEQRKGMWAIAQGLSLYAKDTEIANDILGRTYGWPAAMSKEEADKVILEIERRQANVQPKEAAS